MNRSRIGGDTKFTWLLEACWPKGKHFPFLDSYCTGCFCSHVTKRTILETGCHRHHQGESIYITNFRLIHSIYSSLSFFFFACSNLWVNKGSEVGTRSSDVFPFCFCFLWNPMSAASNSRRTDQNYSGRKPTNNPHSKNNADFKSYLICLYFRLD